jgi:hypothetical protein
VLLVEASLIAPHVTDRQGGLSVASMHVRKALKALRMLLKGDFFSSPKAFVFIGFSQVPGEKSNKFQSPFLTSFCCRV